MNPAVKQLWGALIASVVLSLGSRAAWSQDRFPLKRTVDFHGIERTYFVALPEDFDPETTYWPLVFAHGGAGNAQNNRMALSMWQVAGIEKLSAILILPEFVTADKQVSRFPALGEGMFLEAVLVDARKRFQLHKRILLAGYSMGGQFAHRFAMAHPELVLACAPFAAGTWTTPDGRLLIEGFGEVEDPASFLVCLENSVGIPERLHNLFDARTARVAGLRAAAGAKQVPFLVMCGTLDSRFDIAVAFEKSLREAGFVVESEWPKTPHGSRCAQFTSEFERFPNQAVRFFRKQIERQ